MNEYDSPFAFLDSDDPDIMPSEYQFLPKEWSMEDSYWEYIGRVYENKLSDAISQGTINIRRNSTKVPNPTMMFAENIRLVMLDCVEGENTAFFMDAVLAAEIILGQEKRGEWATDKVKQWFRVRGYIDLKYAQKNCIGYEILVYDRSDRIKGIPLTTSLRRVMSRKAMELEAESILIRHEMRDEANKCMPVDPCKLIAAMKYNLKELKLSRNGKIKGKTFIDETTTRYYKPDGTHDYEIICEKTICIDYEACGSREKVNEVLMHECVHPQEHALFFRLQRNYNDRVDCLACFDSRYRDEQDEDTYESMLDTEIPECAYVNIKKPDGSFETKSEYEWVEWQARTMGRMLQMPYTQTKRKIEELIRKHTDGKRSVLEITEKVISDLAEFYIVTKETARVRMIELGYGCAWGVGIEMDGATVPSFKRADGKAPKLITYTVDVNNAVWLFSHDEELQRVMTKHPFVFLENHFVLYCDKYVTGSALTEYARNHIDECCIAFRVGLKYQVTDYDKWAFHNDKSQKGDPIAAAMASVPLDAIMAMTSGIGDKCDDLPAKLSKTFKFHRENTGLNQEELGWRMGTNDKMIRRIETGEQNTPDQYFLALAGHVMKLQGWYTEDMMNKAGRPLLLNEHEHLVLRFVIYCMYMRTIEDCDKVLVNANCSKLRVRKGNVPIEE